EQALSRELNRSFVVQEQAEILQLTQGPGAGTPRTGEPAARALLASALTEKVSAVERRIFLLLAVLYPDADMENIYAGIHDASAADAPRRRANAVELLDNLLDRRLKQKFLPLLDEIPRADKLRLVNGAVVIARLTRDQT